MIVTLALEENDKDLTSTKFIWITHCPNWSSRAREWVALKPGILCNSISEVQHDSPVSETSLDVSDECSATFESGLVHAEPRCGLESVTPLFVQERLARHPGGREAAGQPASAVLQLPHRAGFAGRLEGAPVFQAGSANDRQVT